MRGEGDSAAVEAAGGKSAAYAGARAEVATIMIEAVTEVMAIVAEESAIMMEMIVAEPKAEADS